MTPKLPPTDSHEYPPTTELRGRRVKIARVEGTMDSVEVDYELHSAPSSSISLVSCLCGLIAATSRYLRMDCISNSIVNFYLGSVLLTKGDPVLCLLTRQTLLSQVIFDADAVHLPQPQSSSPFRPGTSITINLLPMCSSSLLTITQFTLALLIRSETGFAPMRAFTLHQLIRINDLIRIKLNHLLETVVSHRFSLLRVLIASVDATAGLESKRSKSDEINARCCIRIYGFACQ